MALVLSAHKDHGCFWCGGFIKKGLPYERISIRFNNWQMRSYPMHLECAEAHEQRERDTRYDEERWTPGDDYEERPKL